MSKTRALLMKKLLTICPVCKKPIYGRDIDINKIDIKKINRWPMKYVHCHSHEKTPLHALTLYIDANFSVRANEVSDILKIQDV
ncbi:MAG: hypothetical protein GF317_24635 [Candidatus Lokiarchaeota archaeon]|nr:hypothetical protein [Candidatus Lokiarchaeota archaeon]MBD3202551.1 hypothetical protein [Candidatus Lokiarchaeota archaeon]